MNIRLSIHGRDGVIIGEAVIDASDALIVAGRRWHQDKDGAVWCHVRKPVKGWTTAKLHRLITGAPAGMDVDHINHDRRDNRRCNLRVCTHAQNMQNHLGLGARSGYRGVRQMKGGNWHARIQINKQDTHLGAFKTKELAWAARREAEIRVRGEFAPPEVA